MFKIIKKVLFKKNYEGYCGLLSENNKIETYIELVMCFDFREGLRFTCSVPNISSCNRNPFKAIFRILEHESIGMGKYNRVKDVIRAKGWHKAL